MADCMKLAEKELYTLLLESVGRAVAAGTLPAEPMNTFKIEVPADKSHGDFAANIAMVNAKAFRMPPRKIAEAIFNELQLQGSSFEKAEIADKTEKKMEKDGSSTKEMYIKWKKGNNVTAESQWNNINFKEAIFTLEDVK